MKINEVEALVGITRKNIRFYESEGLLAPRRNSENGYRDYGGAEVSVLLQIKLMRKLGVSLEEIRRMQNGTHTVGDGMRRHLVTLERDRDNLEQAIRLCAGLTDRQERLGDLDAGSILKEMEDMEQGGATFQNKQKRDVRIRYLAPVAITTGMVLLICGPSAVDHRHGGGGRASGVGAPGAGPDPPGGHRRCGAGPGPADTGNRERRD